LIEDELYEIGLLSDMLPKVLSREETEKLVSEIIAEGNNNIGMVMKAIGKIDGVDRKLVSEICREKF
jgi:uncharacterized protein YqeY